MEKSIEILNELQSISPALATMEKVNIFQVPEGYFNDLSQRVSTSILLHQYKKVGISGIPEGYFDGLSGRILSKIKSTGDRNAEEEIKTISPVLYSLKNKNVFTVPVDYFEKISEKITYKLNNKSAKVISINKAKKWWKYAAAVVAAIAITIGSLQVFNNEPTPVNSGIATTADVPGYLQLSFQYKTPEELENGIASLSDDEIVIYLLQHGNIMDNSLLTKNIDTKELPDPTDYLLNENTLNNFLNTIDAQASNENSQ